MNKIGGLLMKLSLATTGFATMCCLTTACGKEADLTPIDTSGIPDTTSSIVATTPISTTAPIITSTEKLSVDIPLTDEVIIDTTIDDDIVIDTDNDVSRDTSVSTTTLPPVVTTTPEQTTTKKPATVTTTPKVTTTTVKPTTTVKKTTTTPKVTTTTKKATTTTKKPVVTTTTTKKKVTTTTTTTAKKTTTTKKPTTTTKLTTTTKKQEITKPQQTIKIIQSDVDKLVAELQEYSNSKSVWKEKYVESIWYGKWFNTYEEYCNFNVANTTPSNSSWSAPLSFNIYNDVYTYEYMLWYLKDAIDGEYNRNPDCHVVIYVEYFPNGFVWEGKQYTTYPCYTFWKLR